MNKKTIKSHKGVRGRRIKIEPVKKDSILLSDDANQMYQGKVVAVGPQAYCKKGDFVIFNPWSCDRAIVGEETFYYVIDTDEGILEIL